MALLRQLSGDGGPDKSGCAGNKNLHRASIDGYDTSRSRTACVTLLFFVS
jgi:hypothetical protein